MLRTNNHFTKICAGIVGGEEPTALESADCGRRSVNAAVSEWENCCCYSCFFLTVEFSHCRSNCCHCGIVVTSKSQYCMPCDQCPWGEILVVQLLDLDQQYLPVYSLSLLMGSSLIPSNESLIELQDVGLPGNIYPALPKIGKFCLWDLNFLRKPRPFSKHLLPGDRTGHRSFCTLSSYFYSLHTGRHLQVDKT